MLDVIQLGNYLIIGTEKEYVSISPRFGSNIRLRRERPLA
jgi:hypothetical protein